VNLKETAINHNNTKTKKEKRRWLISKQYKKKTNFIKGAFGAARNMHAFLLPVVSRASGGLSNARNEWISKPTTENRKVNRPSGKAAL